jgi:hypothetical protein
MKLTGNTRYRVGWRKRLILQVEYRYLHSECHGGFIDCDVRTDWRDARLEDLAELERMPS